jgi:asparagine synthase (glutamine-hydrolysing)
VLYGNVFILGTMAWGLEARVPFLDTKLLDVAMTLAPEFKHPQLTPKRIEKELLRRAFDVSDDDGFGHVKPYLPEDILWRQKEQFSDGVGYSWIDGLKNHAESMVSDEQWAQRDSLYPYNTPTTREAFFFRSVFESYYCPESLCPTNDDKLPILQTVVKWIPRRDWGCAEDPSGRAQVAHASSYDKGLDGQKRPSVGDLTADAKKVRVAHD